MGKLTLSMNRDISEYDAETRESIETVTWQHVVRAAGAVKGLCDAIRSDFDTRPHEIKSGTLAYMDAVNCRYVVKAWVFGRLHLMSAIDHAFALHRLTIDPCLPIAQYSCARVILEQCTLTYWLLDPSVDWRERTIRIVKDRRHEIHKYREFHDHYKHGTPEDSGARELPRNLLDEEADIIALMRKLGLESEIGNSAHLGMTRLTDEFVGEMSFDYRLLSSVSHGREWTLIEEFVEYDETNPFSIETSFDLYHSFSVVNYCVNWIAKANWSWYVTMGWDFGFVERLLTEYYVENGVLPKSRFVPPTH